MRDNKYITTVEGVSKDSETVVKELTNAFCRMDKAGIVLFCSSEYNLKTLASKLSQTFSCPIIACTTAGEIGTKYQSNGFVASAFSADKFKFHSHLIHPLKKFDIKSAIQLVDDTYKNLKFSKVIGPKNMFGLLLIDSTSMREEPTVAILYEVFQGLPIIGGSAGNNLRFETSYIYHNGQFISDAAVFAVIETLMPFEAFRLHHFMPLNDEMIVTDSSLSKRIVYELNGDVAVNEYARIIGISPEKLNSQIFAMYPLMLQIGGEWYIRSIQKINSDGSLKFYCAIDVGLPLTIAKSEDFISNLENKVKSIQNNFQNIELTLGCDCILRRIEMQKKEIQQQTEHEMQKIKFMGFSSYGEQYNAIHMNHTLTGISIGSKIDTVVGSAA